MADENVARSIEVHGIVQGVGFRPFVFQLARRFNLKGEVANTSEGVKINIEGPEKKVASFCDQLEKAPPPLAHITHIYMGKAPEKNFQDFCIIKSESDQPRSTLISPDMAICEDCLRELFDPEDHRFEYPFINCTNCGPRYTIIEDIPYDRPKTSMKNFTMCEKCQAEYDDPMDRRFHAQPNACHECGPRLRLLDRHGIEMPDCDPLSESVRLIEKGCILAIKGLGGFHLCVDAQNADAVEKLRKRKNREEKPLAMMAPDMDAIEKFAHVEPPELSLLRSARRPIVILRKKSGHRIADAVAPNNQNFGVMLPYTPLHYLLLRKISRPLVMTSGNHSEEPIAIDNQDALRRLSEIADFFLVHDRDIYLRADDSIVFNNSDETRFIRRSRGYIPTPVFLKEKVPSVLACGAELKNTICLTKADKAFLSQHIGDLENLPTLDFFKMTIGHMKRILDIEPEVIVCDMHPDYLSTRFALERQELPVIQVQHHHAHIVSCMAENRESGTVIGLSLDGTGYGPDNTIWGGEVLISRAENFIRVAHPTPVPMPGGAAAIREPWRMAISYLYHVYGEKFMNLDLPMLKSLEKDKIDIIVEMIQKKINAPLTSSLGRLFDGVAAILGIRNTVAFEGQAPMELEMIARMPATGCYEYGWNIRDRYFILLEPIIEGVVGDLQKGVSIAEISGKFHHTVIRMFSRLCLLLRYQRDINVVALSGGVFQNSILLAGFIRDLRERNFKVISHRLVPSNDGGISLGQAAAASAMLKKGKFGYEPGG